MMSDEPAKSPIGPTQDDEWIREPLAEMKRRDAQSMPGWFIPGLAAAIAWVGLGIWLMQKVHWPYAFGYADRCPYGFRGCEFLDLERSPALLDHPTASSLALFAWFASMVGTIAWIVHHRFGRKPIRYSSDATAFVVGAAAFALLAYVTGGQRG